MRASDRASPDIPVALPQVLERARRLGFLGPGPLDRHLEHALGFGRTIAWALGRDTPSSRGPQAAVVDSSPTILRPPETKASLEGELVDLGSGGGVPGLVLAVTEPALGVTLLDANARRCEFLDDSVHRLGISDRVSVVHQRAELVGRDPAYRARFQVATARSFGPPAVTAECAAPLLMVGGFLVTSEPPVEQAAASVDLPLTTVVHGPRETAEVNHVPARRDWPGEGSGSPAGTGTGENVGGSTRWPAAQLDQLGMVPLEPHADGFAYQVVRQVAGCPERFPRRVGVPAKRPLF